MFTLTRGEMFFSTKWLLVGLLRDQATGIPAATFVMSKAIAEYADFQAVETVLPVKMVHQSGTSMALRWVVS